MPQIAVRDARQGNWFWDFQEVIDSPMPPQAKLVRLCLARFANHDQLCWPSIDTIANVLGLSRASVVRALKYLVDHGWIERVPHPPDLKVRATVYALKNPPIAGEKQCAGKERADRSVHPAVPNGTVHTESAHKEPVQGEPVPTEPVHREPVHREPVPTEPVPTEPVHREPGTRTNRTRKNKSPSSSPNGEEEGDAGAYCEPNHRTLIAELTRKLHSIPGVRKLSGHYSLIGRAYKEYGYGVVAQALEDVEFVLLGRRDMGLPDLSERDLAKLLFQKCRWNWKDPNLAKYRDKEEPKVPPDQPYFPEVIDIHEWCRRHGYRVVKDGPCGLVVKIRDEERGEEGVAEDA